MTPSKRVPLALNWINEEHKNSAASKALQRQYQYSEGKVEKIDANMMVKIEKGLKKQK